MRSPKTDILVTTSRQHYVADNVSLYRVRRLMKRGGLVPVRPYRSSGGRIYLNAAQVVEVREVRRLSRAAS